MSLSYIYLSNNSISGSLPAIWGDSVNGWGQYLQGLYLDTNQLTGQLPLLWSESNSLSNLYRVDLFLNKLTGSVAWNPVNLPSLGNLVLLPGALRCLTYGCPVMMHTLSLPVPGTILPLSATWAAQTGQQRPSRQLKCCLLDQIHICVGGYSMLIHLSKLHVALQAISSVGLCQPCSMEWCVT